MKIGKTILVLGLLFALCVSPALAADMETAFPAYREFNLEDYADVEKDSWYESAIQVCVETTLMTGVSDDRFGMLSDITIGECATIASRMREQLTGELISQIPTDPWYQRYMDYLKNHGVTVPNQPERKATRQEFFDILAQIVPPDSLEKLNSITSLPDTSNASVLAYYNAGILKGTDANGTFAGSRTLTRVEVAAMISRVVRPQLRLQFTLGTSAPSQSADPDQLQQELDDTMAMMVNGQSLTLGQFTTLANQIIYEANHVSEDADPIDLTNPTILEGIKTKAKTQGALYLLNRQQAKVLSCKVSELPQKLTPNPSRAALGGYAESLGCMAAKHILVDTEEEANTLIEYLSKNPTSEYFDQLMNSYSTDPGLKSAPKGYLFWPGEFVQSFEAETKALEVGQFSTKPVKSEHGYHILWKLAVADLLDGVDTTELVKEYQDAQFKVYQNTWLEECTKLFNDAMIEKLNLKDAYEHYVQQLGEK